jgi:hypothetical protein
MDRDLLLLLLSTCGRARSPEGECHGLCDGAHHLADDTWPAAPPPSATTHRPDQTTITRLEAAPQRRQA